MLAMIVLIVVMVVAITAFELCMSCPHDRKEVETAGRE
ncbi:hypothetical protein H4W81_006242 [Nonomuraea africana]|uniref:Uncharacterized protein n=1 Tax=Nonomuraea africana TaxID=46171 RepID=A0ABR9KN66_9ACTN|nr:hypothetical protein [Nonomuraea africana]